MFEKEIKEYERIRQEYQQKIADRMGEKQWMEYNEIQFSAHSCAIEGNSFTVDDTRILREQGMAMIPVNHSLLECTEMADHFRAFDYMASHLDHPLLIIRLEDRAAYISALKQIRTDGTDEHLIAFFFKTAISRMKSELSQKRKNSLPTMFF